MNKQILVGTVGKNAECKDINGVKICVFTVATSENIRKNGKWEQETEWHNIKCFGKAAEYTEKFEKGDTVEVTGSKKTEEYNNKAGQKVKVVYCYADSVKRTSKANSEKKAAQKPQPVNETQNLNPAELEPQDGDLPF